jgi:organic hydroperoxide reductase OsmC/OhrA
MNLIIRRASVRWKGRANGGTAASTTGSGRLKKAGSSLGSMLTRHSETNSAEWIAAAHAHSFSQALLKALRLKSMAVGEIVTTATVTLENLAAGWTIMNSHITILGKLPKVTQGKFIDATVRAQVSCLVSQSLRASVSINAKLEN